MLLKDVLIIFVKYPQAGLVKTRLAKEIGKNKACLLYRLFVETILKRTPDKRFSRIIFYWPVHKKKEMRNWLGNDFKMYPQKGKDLGERLSQAFKFVFQKGAKRVVAIGTDSPTLDKRIILDAFCELETRPCVIGPSLDGGYYLIGLSIFKPELFKGISWGEDVVFGQTVEQLRRLKLSYSLLEPTVDVDSYRDILLLRKKLKIAHQKNPPGLNCLLTTLDKLENLLMYQKP